MFQSAYARVFTRFYKVLTTCHYNPNQNQNNAIKTTATVLYWFVDYSGYDIQKQQKPIQFFIHSRSTYSTTRGIIQIIACMKIHHGGHIVQLLDSIYIMSNHKSLLSCGAQQILFILHS